MCECFVPGGPWIEADPSCPFHGIQAQILAEQEAERISEERSREEELEDRVSLLEEEVRVLQDHLAKIKEALNIV